MGIEAVITLSVVGLVLALLMFTRYSPEVVMLGGLTLLLTANEVLGSDKLIGGDDVLAGLSNPGVVTVGVLFVVVSGLRQTGAMTWLAGRLLGRPRHLAVAQARLLLPVGLLSAFMNNTPLVAMMLPIVDDWAKKLRLSVSKLLMPMAYASTLGGTCTLIGTSTILLVNGLIIEQLGPSHGLSMFSIARVGLPCAITGVVFLLVFSRWLLPERKRPITLQDDPRRYTVEMLVDPTGPLVGRTIEQANLRHLPGLFLVEIDRGHVVVPAAGPNEKLLPNDRLVFAGIVESVVDLQKIRGLLPATGQVFKLEARRSSRCLVEAVVSDTCPLVGRTIREGRFRTRYNAVVIAVARSGQRINMKIGDIVLRSGDVLLLETTVDFAERQRDSSDFFLVSRIEDSAPPRHEKAGLALALLGAMVAVVSVGWLTMLNAALLCAGLMIVTGCCSAASARRSVDWQVMLVIASAFGLGRAMQNSGAAHGVAEALMRLAGAQPHVALAVVAAMTMLATNVISSNAAAVLMFPIAMEAARDVGAAPMPFAIAVALAAALSFATPIGYQTNLMVLGPGGYRFSDYVRVGLPMSVILLAMVIWLVPVFWGFG